MQDDDEELVESPPGTGELPEQLYAGKYGRAGADALVLTVALQEVKRRAPVLAREFVLDSIGVYAKEYSRDPHAKQPDLGLETLIERVKHSLLPYKELAQIRIPNASRSVLEKPNRRGRPPKLSTREPLRSSRDSITEKAKAPYGELEHTIERIVAKHSGPVLRLEGLSEDGGEVAKAIRAEVTAFYRQVLQDLSHKIVTLSHDSTVEVTSGLAEVSVRTLSRHRNQHGISARSLVKYANKFQVSFEALLGLSLSNK